MPNLTWLLQPTSPTAEPLWVSTKTRTTTDLVTSCVFTLIVCVWTAVHLNIPSYEQRTTRSGWLQRAKSRLIWMLLALFAPEFVLWTALHQFMEARGVALKLAEIEAMEVGTGETGTAEVDTMEADTAEKIKHSPLSPSKKATDDSPPPVSDPATSLQRSTVPDEENQLPSHPSPTISVLQEPEEQKAPTVELKPAIGNGGNKDDISVEYILSHYDRVSKKTFLRARKSSSDQRQLQFPRLLKACLSFLQCIAKCLCIYMKATSKALSPIWDPVQQLSTKYYYLCFPPGLERGFYIVMGGYEPYWPGIEARNDYTWEYSELNGCIKFFLSGSDRRAVCYGEPSTLTSLGAISLAQLGLLPKMRREEIQDKSKADSLAKSLVCLQASWMILQCIARKAQSLPVTLLEVNTLVHVVCALLMYLFWLYKPQGVTEPTQVPLDPRMKALRSLAMFSYKLEQYDSSEDVEKLEDELEWSADVGFVNPDLADETLTSLAVIKVNIDRQFRLKIERGWWDIYLKPKLLSKVDISDFCKMVMARRAECQRGYIPFTNYHALTKSASNFPRSRGKLTRGVNIEEGTGLLLAIVVTALYGGVHLIPWYGHFATHLERILWRACGLLVASGGLLLCIFIIMDETSEFRYQKRFIENATRRIKLSDISKLLLIAIVTFPFSLLAWLGRGIAYLIAGLYILARVYMVVEAFASLRSLPLGAYQTVTWVDIIPHF